LEIKERNAEELRGEGGKVIPEEKAFQQEIS